MLNKLNLYRLLVFLLGLISYLILSQFLDVQLSEGVMFDYFNLEADSYSYYEVGQWIYHQTPSPNLAYRPVLFPFTLVSLFKVGGVWAIFIYHIVIYCWSHYLIHMAVKKISKSVVTATLASFLFLSNFTLIGLTYHGLSEPTVIFGLSLILYLLAIKISHKIYPERFWSLLIVAISLLVLVKPVFLIPALVVLLLAAYLLIRKKMRFTKKIIISICISVGMLVGQASIVKYNFGEFKISKIGEVTYKNYLFSQVYLHKTQMSRAYSMEAVNNMSNIELKDFVTSNLKLTVRTFCYNIIDNIQADPFMQVYKDEECSKESVQYMKTYNIFLFYFLLLIALLTSLQALLIYKSNPKRSLLILGILFLLVYMVCITGIAYGQRDRLIITSMPLWIFLGTLMLNPRDVKSGFWLNKKD